MRIFVKNPISHMLLYVTICMCVLSCPALWEPMDCSPVGSSAHGLPRQEYWSGLPFPSSRDPPSPVIKPNYLASPALADRFFTTGATWGTL